MEKFYCPKCNKIFTAEGEKKEWQSSIFGYCWKLVAKCPDCGTECDEWRPKGPSGEKGENTCSGGTCSICPGCY
jgi:primosomal protein N'